MDRRENQYFPTNKFPKIASSSRQWSTSKNPRIIRASNVLGGKDRHSKVFTIRGLRDRRIRLSEATAIQLYGLQHRLGFGQPSKVVDWLIDAAKEEIDKLPPLPIMPRFHQPNEPLLTSTTDQDYQGLVGFVPQNLQMWDHSRTLSLSQFGGGFSLGSTRQIEDYHHHHQTMALSHNNVVSHATMIPSFTSNNIDQTSMDSNDQSSHMISSMRTFGFM